MTAGAKGDMGPIGAPGPAGGPGGPGGPGFSGLKGIHINTQTPFLTHNSYKHSTQRFYKNFF